MDEINLDILDHLTTLELEELEALLTQLATLERTNQIAKYFTDPLTYLKHREFFAVGKKYRQRLFRAGNRVGKSTGAAFELACHLTGNYPEWWDGRRFDGCTSWWVCGKSSETVRQILQPMLLGQVGEFGTGMIPAEFLDFASLTDAKKASTNISTFKVKHKTGSYSQVEFKSYEAGRGAFEGTERNIWCDEEPPLDVYSECLLRTMTGDCMLMMTFTPLRGASEVVMSFAKDGVFEDGEVGLGKYVVSATWDDVPHLTEQAKAELLASTPPYQRDARSKGIPALGSGVIYPVQEDEYLVDPFQIPAHWPRLYGMDVGGKTAAVWTAIDPDTGILYTYTSYFKEREEPSIHAAAIKGRGEWIPGAIDPASRGRSQIDGQQLMQMYKDLGLKVTNAINAVETGLYTVWELLSTGQLKVFRGQDQFMREIRSYSRDEKGRVIKANDHLMDSWRYSIMTRDIAKTNLAAKPRAANHAQSNVPIPW